MSSFQNSSENNSDNAKQSWLRNGLLGLLLMGVLYLFYTQFGQNKKTDLTVSQMQMNAEEIKTINIDLQRLRDDIKDNRSNIQEKQKKIDALQAKLEKVYMQQNSRNDDEREEMMALLKKQIAQLSVDKTRLQAQMTKTIGEYEVRIADFQKISIDYLEAWIECDVKKMPQQLFADQKGISLSAAKSRVQRAREIIKKVLMDCCFFEFDVRGSVLNYTPLKKDRKCLASSRQ